MFLGLQVLLLVLTFMPFVPAQVQAYMVAAGIGVVGFAFCFGTLAHERSLCEPCINEMPPNGPQKAEDWDRYLAAFHWLFRASTRRFLIILVLWVTFNLTSSHLFPDRVSAVLTFIPVATVLVLQMRHNRVVPWCKRCGWEDGGEHEFVPDPDPAVSA